MASTRDFIVKNGLVVLGQGSTQATSTNTGALVVQGGAGILGNVVIGGTSSSTNTSSGAVQVQGGVGIGGDLYARNIYSNNFQVLTSATIGTYGVSAIFAGTDTAVSASTGSVVIWNTSTLQSITNRSATTTNVVYFASSNASTSPTTGGLQVTNGLGVGGNIYAGGNVVAYGSNSLFGDLASSSTFSVSATRSLNLIGVNAVMRVARASALGDPAIELINLNTSTGAITTWWDFYSNVSDNFSIRRRGTGANADLFANFTLGGTTFGVVPVTISTWTNATSTTTGALKVVGGVGVQGDLYASGVYDQNARVWTTATLTNLNQLSNTTTQYLTSSTLGQYGVSSIQAGTGIAVSNPAGIVTITNVGVVSLTGTPYIGISAASGSNISITNLGVQSLTAGADISVSASTGTITVSGTGTFQTVTNRGSTTTNAIRVANTTSVNSTNTGALQVQGGVGIGGGLFVGGAITATSVTINGFPVSTSSVITASYFGSPLGQFTNLNFATGTTATIVGGSVTVQSIGASVTVSDTPPLSPSGGNLWWDSTVGVLRVYYVDPNSSEWVDAFPVMVGPQGPAGATGTFTGTLSTQLGLTNNTASTSTNTGALTVGGGVGIGGDLYVGGTIVANQLTIQYTTVTTALVTTDDIIITTNNTSATSTTTGALRIAGGAGIGGKIWAEQLRQTSDKIAIGSGAGASTQSAYTIAIGSSGGYANEYGTTGTSAGGASQGAWSIAIGPAAGAINQGTDSVALGDLAGATNQGIYAVSIGVQAGQISQGQDSVAIGDLAGYQSQSTGSVAVGAFSGRINQGQYTVAVGRGAGQSTQTIYAVAVGLSAGNLGQGRSAVAVGPAAGLNYQKAAATAVGDSAGSTRQGSSATSVGAFAGWIDQGDFAIAIGNYAGHTSQASKSIVINATGDVLNASNTGTYIAPIRADATTSATTWCVYYNPVSKEITTASVFSTSTLVSSAVYATTSSLAAYATTASLAAYATTSSIATSAAYATTASLAAYATTSSIATSAVYATTSSLASYATTSSIATSAAYATTASLAAYATTSSIASTATSAAVAYSIVNTSTLQVGFAVNQAGGSVNATTGQFSGITTITNVTASTTTATGALQVAGGVGIGKNINVGPGATNRSIGNANAYGNMFAAAGDSQYVNYILGIKTTTNAATGLTTDHNTAGAANQIILPNSSAYGFKAYVTARDSVNQWMGVWEISGGIRRGATAASTTLVGTPVVTRIAYDTTATTWAATVAADTTNGGLQVRVTGTGTTNITWVANVLTIEVA